MHEGAVEAVVLAVELEVEAQRLVDEADDGVIGRAGCRGKALEVLGAQLGPLGDVKPEGDGPRHLVVCLPAHDHRRQRLWVHAGVPLHGWRRVAR
jgi:hypothetical protein